MQTTQYMRQNQKKENWFCRLWFVCSRSKDIVSTSSYAVSLELKMEIPSGFFGKVYPRSCVLKEYFISSDAGVIDYDFGDSVLVLMMKNSNKPLLIKPFQRIAQIVFHKKEKVVFKKVDRLSGGAWGFGSTGIKFFVFKKMSAQETEYVKAIFLSDITLMKMFILGFVFVINILVVNW